MSTTTALTVPPTALDTPIDERPRLRLSEVFADSRVMVVRQLRKVMRRPLLVIFALVQPILFVLMFRYVFGGAIATGDIDYVDFLLPGIMVQTAVFGAMLTGIGLSEDTAVGVVDRMRSLPMSRSAVIIGRTAADIVVNAMTLVVMVLVGIAVGFRPSEPAWELAAAFALILAFSYVFSWISGYVGLAIRDPEIVQSAGLLWVLPLTFVSSAFVPPDTMPGAIQWFAEVNPVSVTVDAARALTVGQGDALGPTLGTLAWLAALLLIFVPLAVRAFRKA